MMRLATVFAAIALIGTPFFAADMALAAQPQPVAAPAWTGAYVGLNVGYGWGAANNNISFTQTDPSASPASFSANDHLKSDSGLVGAQAGYNWQVGRYLVGLETDIQARSRKGTSDTFNSAILSPDGPNPATVIDNENSDWFGTVRGRFGLTFDDLLVYGTGGLAYGRVHLDGNILPANGGHGINNAPIVWDYSNYMAGWAAGAGIEDQMSSHWSLKVEYLFVDLSAGTSLSGGQGLVATGPIFSPLTNCYGSPSIGCNFYRNPASGTITSRLTDNILRLGLNYQFH